ncbi:MAG TPA: response regulator [Limnochordales bacterium]
MNAPGGQDHRGFHEHDDTRHARILAVDDDADILYTIKAICEAAGWHMDGASDGAEALRLLRERRNYDLVLLDYHMPRMDGLTLLGFVREEFPQLPVLVLTVDEDQATADAFLDAGATDFALKPIKAPDLIARIRLHLRLAAAEQQLERRPQEELPKGIQRQTLEAIVAALRETRNFVTQQELAEMTGFAYQTVCRYVAHLEDAGRVDVQLNYGQLGRPKKLVRWRDKRK